MISLTNLVPTRYIFCYKDGDFSLEQTYMGYFKILHASSDI